MQEIQLHFQMDHRNIVKYYGSVVENDTLKIIMEKVPGGECFYYVCACVGTALCGLACEFRWHVNTRSEWRRLFPDVQCCFISVSSSTGALSTVIDRYGAFGEDKTADYSAQILKGLAYLVSDAINLFFFVFFVLCKLSQRIPCGVGETPRAHTAQGCTMKKHGSPESRKCNRR